MEPLHLNNRLPVGHAVIVAVIICLIIILGTVWYWQSQEEGSLTETAQDVSESIPEIQTNPGEKVPEVNPLDRANPFKYENPLR